MIEKAYGASVRGKMHIQNKLPNQDAFLVDNSKYYTLAVVCDGLGSKKHSRVASYRLCKIIKKEVHKRFKKRALEPYDLVASIQSKYKKRIWPFNLTNCDTTCLFSLISSTSIMLFQLGDGLNAIVFNNDIVKCEITEKDFTNETRAFGNSKKSDWLFKMVKKEDNTKYELILCTDGISEDIIDDTAVEFIHTVSSKTIGKNKNNPILKDILDSWPNKYSSDDKTIVVVK